MMFKMLFLLVFIGLSGSAQKNTFGTWSYDIALLNLNKNYALKSAKLTLDGNPNNITYSKNFLELFRKMVPSKRQSYDNFVERYYRELISHNPKSFELPLTLGEYYLNLQDPRASVFLLKAAALDSMNSTAWKMLSSDAARLGDIPLRLSYLQRAIKSDIGNAELQLDYAYLMREIDKQKGDSLLLSLVSKFHNEEPGCDALYYLAFGEPNKDLQLKYLKELELIYCLTDFQSLRRGMAVYYNRLINEGSYNDANNLAEKMVSSARRNKLEWKHKLKTARQFLTYSNSIKNGEDAQGLKQLDSIILMDHFSATGIRAEEHLFFLRADLKDKLGNTSDVYLSILLQYSKAPTYRMNEALYHYGRKIGKDSVLIFSEVQKIRKANLKPATPFSLISFQGNQRISSKNLKGKLILFTYWFPGCGPCKAEFPHFDNVLKKFDKNKIVYLAVNGLPEQDPYVIPFLKASGHSFTALHDSNAWVKGNLKPGYPKNYLIDKNGNIAYAGFRIDESNEDTLELMIKELL